MFAHLKKKPEKNREFLDWIARQGCKTCASRGVYHASSGEWLVDPSHIKTRKSGGSDLGNAIGQCRQCHHLLGRLGMTLFESRFKTNLARIAKQQAKEFLRLQRNGH